MSVGFVGSVCGFGKGIRVNSLDRKVCGTSSSRGFGSGVRRAEVRMTATQTNTALRETKLTDPAVLLAKTNIFIFDCDGVIWRGDSVIEGIPETLDYLRSIGKRLFFVTNNSTKSRKQYAKKFEGLGLNAEPEEIFSSSFAAAAYLEQTKFNETGKKVYIIGEVGIEEELALNNIPFIGGESDKDKAPNMSKGGKLIHDHDVGAVVVGFDRNINYYKIQVSFLEQQKSLRHLHITQPWKNTLRLPSLLIPHSDTSRASSSSTIPQYAQLCINENDDCEFIATNLDAVTHLTDAQEWAGNGSMVGAIKGCTGKEPTVVGKPSPLMINYICEKYHVRHDEVCMVGDRLDTDVLFGKNNGLESMLVLSGVTTEEKLLSPSNKIHPDYYADSIVALMPKDA